MLFNFRFSTASTSDGLRSRVREILDRHRLEYELEWTLGGEPFLTPRGDLVDAVAGAIKDVTGIATEVSTTGVGRFIKRISRRSSSSVGNTSRSTSQQTSSSPQWNRCGGSTSACSSLLA
jgi:acetylornithine deacetylase/succinyl-diaminopimelate desuccinylase-like protein